ncbi:heterokaryon incompatibility protein [Colletotrichum graminicola]|uniref:Heterokaryon incompatibility protein n=1 Tax=Colletotrichum graminicola (strain M1.001 / M2 / FGSC 10212) TaxID=645133 RepID=E3QXB0_COLGM|nr:heterokaryon incompatibility protein [Colletotrichum graminicola M1.001]EFQ35498.1 heterokaryon incompatibility protein [Colletotrichum graminicola M1.001]WDK08759.1 heterokaryon incompatibility protein [Colletotrichum graminicola]
MPLCKACSRLDLGDLLDEDDELQDLVLHDSLAVLKESTTSCDLCRLFFSSITNKLRDEGVGVDESTWSDPNSRVILRGIRYQDEDYLPSGLFWVKVRCDTLSPRAYSYFGLYPEEETQGLEGAIIGRLIKPPEEQISLVNDWVTSCDRVHKGCHSDPGALPTRVVDVGLDGHREPRLVVTGGAAGRYVTLSHCWGLHPVIRTTSETIEDHLKALPLGKLPQTFRDAVLITWSLGIQYIWIDSLCIVQDSTEDWELESVKMGTIYASSYLTIAASASKDSTGGCFRSRSTSTDVKVRFTVRDSGDPRSTSVFVRPRPRDFSHLPMSALHSRAWVTQERLLSARMIHYDTDQLLWECRESRLTEDGVPVGAFGGAGNAEWDERLHFSYPFSQSRSRPNFVWDWYDMVSAYTSRGITKSYDRLPALSGLANAMEECTGQKYVAGLWGFHLAYGLLWRRSEQWLRKPADGYRAPSWSWASLEGRVYMPEIATMAPYGNEMEIMIDIVDVHTTPLGLDPRGMLRSGCLKLKGKLKVADSRVDPATPGHKRFPTYPKELAIDFLNCNDEMVGLAYFDEKYSGKERSLHYLQVARKPMEPSRWHGLLLEPTDEKNQFRRVGFCRTEEIPSRDWFADADEEIITIV